MIFFVTPLTKKQIPKKYHYIRVFFAAFRH